MQQEKAIIRWKKYTMHVLSLAILWSNVPSPHLSHWEQKKKQNVMLTLKCYNFLSVRRIGNRLHWFTNISLLYLTTISVKTSPKSNLRIESGQNHNLFIFSICFFIYFFFIFVYFVEPMTSKIIIIDARPWLKLTMLKGKKSAKYIVISTSCTSPCEYIYTYIIYLCFSFIFIFFRFSLERITFGTSSKHNLYGCFFFLFSYTSSPIRAYRRRFKKKLEIRVATLL